MILLISDLFIKLQFSRNKDSKLLTLFNKYPPTLFSFKSFKYFEGGTIIGKIPGKGLIGIFNLSFLICLLVLE